MIAFVTDDGGRSAAGFKGEAGDCGTRAVAIATEMPYRAVYDALAELNGGTVRDGTPRDVVHRYLALLGWEWTPTMQIGSGCQVHVDPDELPPGRLVLRLSRHFAAVVNGVLHDTHDSSRDGARCVYGYWQDPMSADLRNV